MKAAHDIPPARCNHKMVSIRKIAACITYERAASGNISRQLSHLSTDESGQITNGDKETSLPHSGKLRLRGIVRAQAMTNYTKVKNKVKNSHFFRKLELMPTSFWGEGEIQAMEMQSMNNNNILFYKVAVNTKYYLCESLLCSPF